MKSCYQCDKEVQWLAPDSRCGDCTRLTPEQVRGEEPMPEEAEQELENFINKYNFKEEGDEEDMIVLVSELKGHRLQLNILYDNEFTAYDLFVDTSSKVYKKVYDDSELISFINSSRNVLNSL